MRQHYICYTLSTTQEFRHMLDAFFAEYFFEQDYEIIEAICEEDMIADFGEIYDEQPICTQDDSPYGLRFYSLPEQKKQVEEQMKNLPKTIFLEEEEIIFSEYEVLSMHQQLIQLTENTMIIPKKYEGEQTHKISIVLEAKNAFGTGDHATTKLVAILLEKEVGIESIVLDIGCGTGILAILAAKLGAKKVDGIDSDPVAVQEALAVVADNGLSAIVQIFANDLLAGIEIQTYNIVVANLTLEILCKLLPALAEEEKSRCVYLFSGIMENQAGIFEKMLTEYGFTVVEKIIEDTWCGYKCQKY
ncbi:hypothetical protein AwErysi_02210 [Erysipelotrichaceae bacterium]|nr:hypothetical protein AwErysi_02210 [Erysipelotrichaceae bacterium]